MMYYQLGPDAVAAEKDIVGIFDLDKCSVSKRTRTFLRRAEADGHIVNAATDLPRSIVLCKKSGRETVFFSGLMPATLKKRKIYSVLG